MTARSHRRLPSSRRGVAAALLLAAGALGLAACERDPEITAEVDAGAGGKPQALGCPEARPGARLVRLADSAGEVFCMDEREVTWREYRQFLAARSSDLTGQPPECAWNQSFEPAYEVKDDSHFDSTRCDELERPVSEDSPANCLDFCDAVAYCDWAGKRLCGRVGGPKRWGRVYVGVTEDQRTPEALEAFSKLTTTTVMEFQLACTQGGTTRFPYGDNLVPGRCIDDTQRPDGSTLLPPVTDAATRGCHGSRPPFDALHDLSGSVSEWGNACLANGIDFSCMVNGGSIVRVRPEDLACGSALGFADLTSVNPYRGFRCCADAEPVPGSDR